MPKTALSTATNAAHLTRAINTAMATTPEGADSTTTQHAYLRFLADGLHIYATNAYHITDARVPYDHAPTITAADDAPFPALAVARDDIPALVAAIDANPPESVTITADATGGVNTLTVAWPDDPDAAAHTVPVSTEHADAFDTLLGAHRAVLGEAQSAQWGGGSYHLTMSTMTADWLGRVAVLAEGDPVTFLSGGDRRVVVVGEWLVGTFSAMRPVPPVQERSGGQRQDHREFVVGLVGASLAGRAL